MPEAEPSWSTLGRTVLHDGRMTLVDHAVQLPDGTETRYEVDESVPFAVATLVIDGDDLLLARQYRYPIDRWIFDLPGGAGEGGETPEDAARRELEEELGIVARDLRPLHTFFMNPGRSSWPVHVFVCSPGTTPGVPFRADLSEQVHLVRMPVAELDARIGRGEVVDPTLIVARAIAAAHGMLRPLGLVNGRAVECEDGEQIDYE
jgi:8-oxo-dGTP pyrophosphatase MutT (NUDIX family)